MMYKNVNLFFSRHTSAGLRRVGSSYIVTLYTGSHIKTLDIPSVFINDAIEMIERDYRVTFQDIIYNK
jgi:hypothetical protein